MSEEFGRAEQRVREAKSEGKKKKKGEKRERPNKK